tara:strand:+ start:185 stop:619 length:435 start_codon:yes stop_codon:yes gene_type:complete
MAAMLPDTGPNPDGKLWDELNKMNKYELSYWTPDPETGISAGLQEILDKKKKEKKEKEEGNVSIQRSPKKVRAKLNELEKNIPELNLVEGSPEGKVQKSVCNVQGGKRKTKKRRKRKRRRTKRRRRTKKRKSKKLKKTKRRRKK